jgi:hypothetical protein
VKWILIDPGAAVNLLPLYTLQKIGYNEYDLKSENVVVCGFNQSSQAVVGSISLVLHLDDFKTIVKFHVIDADTSYKAMLGRPWIHRNGVVPSTLHQCLKYIEDGVEKRIIGDLKPFTYKEAHYSDAKFFLNEGEPPKVYLKEIEPQSLKLPQQAKLKVDKAKSRMSVSTKSKTTWKPKEQTQAFKALHLGSDSEEEEISSKGKVKVTKMIPAGLTTPSTKVHASQVEHLKTFTVKNHPKDTIFYRVASQSAVDETAPHEEKLKVQMISTDPKIANMLEKQGLKLDQPHPTSQLLSKLWDASENPESQNNKAGLGYQESYDSNVVMLGDDSIFQVGESSKAIVLGDDSESEIEDKECETLIIFGNDLELEEPNDNYMVQEPPEIEAVEEILPEAEETDVMITDVDLAPPELDDGGQATVDELIEINLGTEDDPRPTFISASLSKEEQEEYKALLYRNRDIFAWSYKEMPGLDTDIAVHRLSIDPAYKPVKQTPRKFHPDLEVRIVEEVDKLIAAGFIEEVQYPTWVANIVPVKKKNGQIRVCVDFRDLNKACPKDDFPLPITEMMVDVITEYKILSFMDGSSGYNQIKMAPEDAIHTAFRTPKGIYCYKVMPFGLKNAGATYQRAMTIIFSDLLHEVVECYVDDLVVKTKDKSNHLNDLQIVFDRLRRHNLKMNPLKCAFGVSSGKFLGFVVRHRGIEIDPLKIKAIQEIQPPKNLTELKSLQGRLAYIRRFISNLAGRCQPFSHLMKKNVKFDWDLGCQNALESIKKYLSNPPVLAAPEKGKLFNPIHCGS